MEGLVTADNNGGCQGFLQDQTQDFPADVGETESFTDSVEDECRNSSSSSNTTASEATTNEERITHTTTTAAATSNSSKELNPLGWPIRKSEFSNRPSSDAFENEAAHKLFHPEIKKLSCKISDVEMMKERFSKLLLGEDMSGSGKGVCSALALSNAITNLCATLFGQLWRLEPLPPEKKSMWKREMECLLCVADHIVELIPSWQTFPDGSKLEVMTCRPRSDLSINLPALRKLDNMLLEILDSFDSTEFWYVEQGIAAPDADNGSATFAKPLKRQAEKWWLPSPCVPPQGLNEDSSKHLQHKRECANQILKAAMAINSVALAEMEIPESYLNALPKNGRASLGDLMHRYITSDHFSPECLLDCLDMSSEHQALEMANRVEASIYVWRRRTNGKPPNIPNRAASKSSWGLVKDLMVDTADKRELLASRAESLLLCLKQRFPGLPQTALDTSKIQFNKDVGKSILESYSRVLESLAYNIVARIDDLLHVDVSTKHLDQNSSISTSRAISQKRVVIPYSVPVPSTPYKTAVATPSFSPAPLVSPSPARKERSPFLNKSKLPAQHRGFGVKKVLVEYLGVDAKEKRLRNRIDISDPLSSMGQESPEPLDEVKHMDR